MPRKSFQKPYTVWNKWCFKVSLLDLNFSSSGLLICVFEYLDFDFQNVVPYSISLLSSLEKSKNIFFSPSTYNLPLFLIKLKDHCT